MRPWETTRVRPTSSVPPTYSVRGTLKTVATKKRHRTVKALNSLPTAPLLLHRYPFDLLFRRKPTPRCTFVLVLRSLRIRRAKTRRRFTRKRSARNDAIQCRIRDGFPQTPHSPVIGARRPRTLFCFSCCSCTHVRSTVRCLGRTPGLRGMRARFN